MANKDLFNNSVGSGRKEHQRMKPFLIYMYLMKYTDENNPASGDTIADVLREDYGICAERRSIYKDIEELNIASIILEQDCTFEEAEALLKDKENKEVYAIIKYKHPHGFYAARRPIEPENARILAECVYQARFIPEKQAHSLIDEFCGFLSEAQIKRIKRDVLLVDRNATNNKATLINIELINEAIKESKYIKFKYVKYNIQDLDKQDDRRKGEYYIVSPYKLLINDGNYYLLGKEDNKDKVLTYRVDRMRNVEKLDITIEKTEEYKNLMNDIKTYTKRVFAMYSGEKKNVEIRFINPLLDTVVDRFGTNRNQVQYRKVDETHFVVSTAVEVSEQFFSWVCGFGKRARIVYPESVVKEFNAFLDKIKSNYE